MQHEEDISYYLCALYRKVLYDNWDVVASIK